MLLWITLLFTLCNSHSYLILIWRKGHQKASSSKWREITCNIGRLNEDQIGILIVYPTADSLLTEHAKWKSFTIEKYIKKFLDETYFISFHFIEIEFGETIHCIVWVLTKFSYICKCYNETFRFQMIFNSNFPVLMLHS